MGTKILLTVGEHQLSAELNDSAVSSQFVETLPASIRMTRWGDEYYGSCGISASETDGAREIMSVGEIAFWNPGSALCLFFGPTPASTDEKPRAASPVVPMGFITGDVSVLKSLGGSIDLEVSRVD